MTNTEGARDINTRKEPTSTQTHKKEHTHTAQDRTHTQHTAHIHETNYKYTDTRDTQDKRGIPQTQILYTPFTVLRLFTQKTPIYSLGRIV